MSGRRPLLVTAASILTLCVVAGSSRVAAQDDVPLALDPDVAALAASSDAGLVDVWVIFAAQPAARIADELAPGYDALVEAARAPAVAALARIEPDLPPRAERGALGVAGIMERERALLTDDEIAAIRASNAEVLRLVQEMRSRTLDAARAECDAGQAQVAAWIEALPGGAVQARTAVIDALIARMPASSLTALAREFPGIARIARTKPRSLLLDTSVATIGASSWTGHSYSGGGQKVAVVDTGIDTGHPAFTTSSGAAVVAASTVRLSVGSTDPSFIDSASSTDDLHSHGTHCAGIVASNDSTFQGVAPSASLLSAKCFYAVTGGAASGQDADIVSATDWALTNGATVLSCSFGGGGTSDGTDPLTEFFDAVVEVSGATVAVAAGNSGAAGTIGLPGDGFNVLTVGAFDDNASASLSDDSLAGYSSRGPTYDGRRKPDLSAPGSSISSTNAFWEGLANDFSVKSGTSMATPHVAGSMALLLSYNTAWRPEALKALLSNTCRISSPVSGAPDSNWGCGALDLGQAYADRTLPVTATLTSSGARAHYYKLGALASGGRSTLAWDRAAAYAGSTPASGGGNGKSLVNLDLLLCNGLNGAQVVTSTSTVDSVEQVQAASAMSDAVLVVYRTGSFPFGKSSQRYALAPTSTTTLANPPALAIASTTGPSDIAGGKPFTFTATLRNNGDLRAPAPVLTLSLPAGFTFSTGTTAAQTVSTLDPFAAAGATATASWSVLAGNANGNSNLSVSAACTGYGSTFTSSASVRTVYVDGSPPSANAGADVSVFATSAAGRTITLSGAATTDNNAAKGIAYAWDTDADGDFSDTPGSATGVTPTVAFAIGTRTVTLRATDYVGNVGSDTVVVEVKDNLPVARAGADQASAEGASVLFDGSASADLEAAIASYAWTFGDGGSTTGATPSHVFRDEGTYTVTLTVTDTGGQTSSDTALVTVSNVAPTAGAGPGRSGNEGSAVVFAGSATDPGADDVLAYAWAFGDGATGSGATPSHVYADEGVYTATLTVTDGDGGTSVSTVQATIANVAPTANAGAAPVAVEGARIMFSGSATDPGANDVLTWAWTFGDGGTGSGATPFHVYANDGVYTATLTVTDGDGGTGVSSVDVAVSNAVPTASAGSSGNADEGATVAFSGSATDLGSDDVLTYAWAFGDGATAAGATSSHVYADEGSYTATLTVTDGDGGTAVATTLVTVSNVAPSASAGSNRAGDEGLPVAFAGTATDPGVNDVLACSWSFGDGGTASTASASHVYSQDGVYFATFTATDGDGGVSASTVQVTVRNQAPVAFAGPDVSPDENAAVQFAGSATDAGVTDVLSYAWDFGDGATAAGAAASHTYLQDGVYFATLTVTDDAGASSTARRRVAVLDVAPEVELPEGMRVGVGESFHIVLAPTDVSPLDAASLVAAWRIVDGDGATLASGAGTGVTWFADRSGAVTLIVAVTDDHLTTERRAMILAETSPLGDAFAAALSQGLDAATERDVLAKLNAARVFAANAAKPAATTKALNGVLGLLARSGVSSGPLVARLAALSADFAAGVAPSPEKAFAVPVSLAGVDELLAAAPRAGFTLKTGTKLLAALIDLRFAKRLGSAKKITGARKKAAAVALTLAEGPVRNWFFNSIRAQ